LGIQSKPLTVGRPERTRVLTLLSRGAQREDIDAVVGVPGEGIPRQDGTSPGAVPRQGHLVGPALESGNDTVGDGLVKVQLRWFWHDAHSSALRPPWRGACAGQNPTANGVPAPEGRA